MDRLYLKGLEYLKRHKIMKEHGMMVDPTELTPESTVGLCLLAFLAHGDDP